MRLGMRGKLALLMALVGVMPLVLGTIILVTGMRRIRLEAFGQKLDAAVQADALYLQISKVRHVEMMLLSLNESWVVSRVEEMTSELDPSVIEQIDRNWARLEAGDEPVNSIINNDLGRLLTQFMEIDPRFVELMITDRHGNLLAATNKTTTFRQSGELWWERTYLEGRGGVYIGPVRYDRSADTWSIELCVPIRGEKGVVGVAKAVTDVNEWMDYPRDVGEFDATAMLLDENGIILFASGIEPLTAAIDDWPGDLGWHAYRISDGMIQAHAPLIMPETIGSLPVDSRQWYILLQIPVQAPMTAVRTLTILMAIIALATIALLFLAGLWLANKSIASRLKMLANAANRVAQGDLSHRISPSTTGAGSVLGEDELDDLARNFDRMIDQVQQTHDELAGADELKSQFIKIASHELRTPVSYILGMAKLLKESKDPDRLLQALQSIAAKAKRLDEIIHAMFKLLPEQQYVEQVRYGPVVLSELMEEVYIDTFPFVDRRNQRMVMELAEGLPDIQADSDKLRDAIENLVMNAIKFTPDGGMIKVAVFPQLDGLISIAVTDQGPGIPRQDLARIFEPFYTGGDVLQHSTGVMEYQKRGIGLGLAVVKNFVQMHRGTVNATSSPTGSTFTISIPISAPPPPGRPDRPA